MTPAIVILDEAALPLARQIATFVQGKVCGPEEVTGCDRHYEDVKEELADWFNYGAPVIGIMAAGIMIRVLGPQLHDKRREPPVIAVSHDGKSVVPLLGGHHGANDMARQIAALTQGHAALTTASDVLLSGSFDAPGPGLVLSNLSDMKAATQARLRGEDVTTEVTLAHIPGNPHHVVYHPTNVAVGLGCERGCDPAELKQLLDDTLRQHDIASQSVSVYATIDLKEDEAAMAQFENLRLFTPGELAAYDGKVPNPSATVKAETGTASVSEAAALAVFGGKAKLLVPKTKSARATVAIAQGDSATFTAQGRKPGTVKLVGIGPGSRGMMSGDVISVLQTTTDWVGYSLYLDLAESLRRGQTRHDFPLGDEEARCRAAIELAKQGKSVALVCSGDAGIYAMAALVYELIDREPARVAVEVHPGISAFQAASARAGAMIGHDFCCISLSDLLTPWEVIEKRLKAAAEGDFVISFYNPRSLKRRDQLQRAFEILKPHRNPDTPVVIASNLGRPEENIRIRKFWEFNPEEVDMLTLVMVGSSQSKAFQRGDGRTYAYTPRGYAKKMDQPK
ncbi:precorrin-3B C(17)-methyltransferase [Aestuariivirga litoralis]|uniref:precorrin-3B C(17)-methyltransferase n=1 Tax=Aestuariivirga litoralis TaxID=2650924 RepID=UPI0018C45EE8|nr:precorrin-3B C(17)-methyltransferase [Aestuariivirga litoralis]MBG1231345.1 precorrin-3B C(17)-methyltransferase [Aestuariivirga litoralis]